MLIGAITQYGSFSNIDLLPVITLRSGISLKNVNGDVWNIE